MEDCCSPNPPGGYDREFNGRFARSLSRQYRRGGLTPSAQLILEFASSVGLDGATVLEIGGGVGDIQLEALKRGASRTTNVELSSAYEPEAARLLDEAGLREHVTRMLGVDLARTPDAVAPADIVVLHRVVCCYPDVENLLRAAAGRAQRAVVFSHPPRNTLARVSARSMNAWFALTGNPYRFFTHRPDVMTGVLRDSGFEPRFHETSGTWRVVGAVRG